MPLVFFCLLVAPLAPLRAGDVPTVEELHARADTARGALLSNVRDTIESTGSLGATKTVAYRLGRDSRTTFDRGGMHSEYGVFRGEQWRQNNNGLTIIANAAEGKEAGEKTSTTVTRVSQPFDAFVLALNGPRGPISRTYYDPVTYRVLRVETFSSTGSTIETVDSYEPFDGIARAKTWTVTSDAAQLRQQYVRTDFTANVVTDADVQEPATRRRLVEFPPGVTDVTLPARFVRNSVVVRVMFGTRGVDVVLDSGAAGIVVDRDLVQQLSLPLTNAMSQVTAQRFTAYDTVIPEMRIGPLVMHNIAVHVGPVVFRSDDSTKELGLLGFDFLAQLGVTIDYQHKTVHVTPAESYVPPTAPGTSELTVRLGSGQPQTTVSVGDAIAEHMVFDTGWTGRMAFFDYFTRRYPQAFDTNLGRSYMTGVGGTFPIDYFRFPLVDLGPIRFRNYVGARVPAGSFEFQSDGVIGNGLLSLFTVGLDYTHGKMYFTPNAAGNADMKSTPPSDR